MGSWGSELWDRYSCVLSHVTRGGEDMAGVYAKYVKERGEIEREYARSVKKCVSKYTNKAASKQSKETTQAKGFRLLLEESLFQAGQHEIIAETLSGKLYQDLQQKSKDILRASKQNLKRAKLISENINKMYKDLEKVKTKYQKSYIDWESARNNYLKADEDDKMSRIEIAKMKALTESRNNQCEENKGAYANHLLRTNQHQEAYYFRELPSVLNDLERIEIERLDYFKQVMSEYVNVEKKVAPMIAKSNDDKERIINTINAAEDSHLLIERLCTRQSPPQDIPFEKMTSETEVKFGTLKRKKSKLKLRNPEKEVQSKSERTEEDFYQSYMSTPLTIRRIENSPGGSRSNSFQAGATSPCYESKVSSCDGFSDMSDSNPESYESENDIYRTVIALYSYAGDCESSIAMEAGEEFLVTEADEEGWTKVRRKNYDRQDSEGFVPSAYLQHL